MRRSLCREGDFTLLSIVVLAGLLSVLPSCSGGGGTSPAPALYSNATLTGIWMSKATIGPDTVVDSFRFDGNGNMVESYILNPGQLPSSYDVQANGSFTLNITFSGDPTVVVAGNLTSATSGVVTALDGNPASGTVRMVTDPGACQGTWSGTLGGAFNDMPFQITVDSTGTIVDGSGLTSPYSGKLFCESGDATGYLATGAGQPLDRVQFHTGTIASGATVTISGNLETNQGVSTYTLVKGAPPDTVSPGIPPGLTTFPTGTSEISLQWSASTDNVGVAGYRIFRDGTLIGDVPSTSFSDTDLSAVTQYCYTLSAYDAAGNESAPSSQKCATTALDLSNEFGFLTDYPSSVAWNGQYAWVSNYAMGSGKKTIYKYDMSSGLVVGTIPTPSEWAGSMCFAGSDLWLIDYLSGTSLFKLSPADGSVLSSFPLTYLAYAGGTAWDGQYLYYAAPSYGSSGVEPPSSIYKVDPGTGSVVQTVYTTANHGIDGLTYKDNSLWYLATNVIPAKIVNISTAGTVLSSTDLPGSELTNSGVGGLVNINGGLWYIRRGSPYALVKLSQ